MELAWAAHERLISANRDKNAIVGETIERVPRDHSPVVIPSAGPMRALHRTVTVNSSPPDKLIPFTDPDFPPAPSSVGKTSSEDPRSRLRISPTERDCATWVRLPDYIRRSNKLGADGKIELFGDIEPNDLTQGIVGDCWLLATMGCLAEFPEAVESLFCGQKEASADGQYTIKLFDLDQRNWEYVVIDDYIPCKIDATGVLNPLFAIPNGNQMWAALLEKAMAKFVGTYAQIAGGHEPFAMIAFTGFPQVYQFKRLPVDAERTVAKENEWERGWAQWASKFSPSCGYRPMLGEDRLMENEKIFERLIEYDRMNYLLAASIICYPSPETADDLVRPDGLVNGHAYSLLSVEQFEDVRLVKLRNPHGQGSDTRPTEWNGRWSDDSSEWTSNPSIANCVGHERVHDGIFWMAFEDFARIFDKVLVLPYPMSQPRGALSSIRRAKVRASMRTAAEEGKSKATMALENLTHMNDVVTALHLMSVRPYDPYLNAPEWVRRDHNTYIRWAHEKLGTSPQSS